MLTWRVVCQILHCKSSRVQPTLFTCTNMCHKLPAKIQNGGDKKIYDVIYIGFVYNLIKSLSVLFLVSRNFQYL